MRPLSMTQAREAMTYNQRKSRSLGWKDDYTRIALLLGLRTAPGDPTVRASLEGPAMSLPDPDPSGEAFAQAVARWQGAQVPPLTRDGKIGPGTWGRMQRDFDCTVMPGRLPSWLTAPPARSERRGRRVRSDASIAAGGLSAPWIDVALSEMHAHWRSDGQVVRESALSVDEEYFAATPYFGGRNRVRGTRNRENAHWCAAFVNYCLHSAGYSHCGSAGPTGFTRIGWWAFEVLAEPRRGCVIVVGSSEARSDSASGYHIGFLDRWSDLPAAPDGDVPFSEARGLYLLGGNQSNTVQSNLETRTMVSVRKGGIRSPYLWPLVGSDTCNCDLPTAQGHFCHAQWQ